MITLAAYQPDIPQNTGALIRLSAALNLPLHLIEPFGFLWDERKIRSSAMDYMDHVTLTRHTSWDHFKDWAGERRIILLSTKAATLYTEFTYKDDDILLLGRESAGVPDNIHNAATARVIIPMNPATRSLNIVIAGAMVVGEALRQRGQFPTC